MHQFDKINTVQVT